VIFADPIPLFADRLRNGVAFFATLSHVKRDGTFSSFRALPYPRPKSVAEVLENVRLVVGYIKNYFPQIPSHLLDTARIVQVEVVEITLNYDCKLDLIME
jgi:hypothetical protein